jgi:hypothetical protein
MIEEELIDEIAMPAVQLDTVEAEPLSIGRGAREGVDGVYLRVPKIRFGVDAASGRRKLAS